MTHPWRDPRTLQRHRAVAALARSQSPSVSTDPASTPSVSDASSTSSTRTGTVEEIGQALAFLALEADFSELATTVTSYIPPGSHGLTYDDFVALHGLLDVIFGCEDGGRSQEEMDLSEALKVFDEDGDGHISANELQAVLGKLWLPEGNVMARVRQMIVSVNQNNDGRVDFYEFKDVMHGVIATSGRSLS